MLKYLTFNNGRRNSSKLNLEKKLYPAFWTVHNIHDINTCMLSMSRLKYY